MQFAETFVKLAPIVRKLDETRIEAASDGLNVNAGFAGVGWLLWGGWGYQTHCFVNFDFHQ